ncbi:hypothetical protein DL93DRAFT_1767032 [Clavulina sp. PMI_390]|nr:hypothetical protein DL93DRAFT_1767032 [Clavulina sp. PMI_390]
MGRRVIRFSNSYTSIYLARGRWWLHRPSARAFQPCAVYEPTVRVRFPRRLHHSSNSRLSSPLVPAIITSAMNVLFETYLLARFFTLLVPGFLQPEHQRAALLDSRFSRGLSLLILDVLTVIPTAVAINTVADVVPFSLGSILVLIAFNYRPLLADEAISVDLVPSASLASIERRASVAYTIRTLRSGITMPGDGGYGFESNVRRPRKPSQSTTESVSPVADLPPRPIPFPLEKATAQMNARAQRPTLTPLIIPGAPVSAVALDMSRQESENRPVVPADDASNVPDSSLLPPDPAARRTSSQPNRRTMTPRSRALKVLNPDPDLSPAEVGPLPASAPPTQTVITIKPTQTMLRVSEEPITEEELFVSSPIASSEGVVFSRIGSTTTSRTGSMGSGRKGSRPHSASAVGALSLPALPVLTEGTASTPPLKLKGRSLPRMPELPATPPSAASLPIGLPAGPRRYQNIRPLPRVNATPSPNLPIGRAAPRSATNLASVPETNQAPVQPARYRTSIVTGPAPRPLNRVAEPPRSTSQPMARRYEMPSQLVNVQATRVDVTAQERIQSMAVSAGFRPPSAFSSPSIASFVDIDSPDVPDALKPGPRRPSMAPTDRDVPDILRPAGGRTSVISAQAPPGIPHVLRPAGGRASTIRTSSVPMTASSMSTFEIIEIPPRVPGSAPAAGGR